MSDTSCYFKFERSTPIYYGGEEIRGHVSFVTSKCLHVESLTVNLVGGYQVQWHDKPKHAYLEHSQHDHSFDYNNSKILYNESHTLVEIGILEVGAHSYEVSFSLPTNCPATMKQQFGEVAYTLQLILHRPAKHAKIYKQRIVIKPLLDLNQLPLHRTPCNETLSIEGYEMHINLPQTAFVPGQAIGCTLKYGSLPASINRVRMSLIQHLTFSSCEPSVSNKHLSKLIAMYSWKIHHQPAANLMSPLTIPATTLNAEWPIQVSYYLEICLCNAQNKKVIKFIKPIIIGTVAFEHTAKIDNDMPYNPYCFDNLGSSVGHRKHFLCERLVNLG